MPLAAARLFGRLLILMLAVPVLAGLGVRARALDWWTETVAVDVTAENAVAARQKGIEQGQREALRRLLERLVPAEDRARLPRVEGLQPARFVRSFEIAEEKVAPTRWLATLNVSFDPEAVGELLAERGVALLEPKDVPVVLVVPAERRGGQLVLWAREDPWWQAWERVAAGERTIRLALPLADLADLAALAPERIAAGDRAALDRLAARYGASDAVVAIAEPRTPVESAGVAVRFLAGTGALRGDPAPVEAAAGTGEPFERAARAAAARLVEAWKGTALLRSDRMSELAFTVPLADLAGWVQIRRELETLPEIRELRVAAIARDRAEIVVRHPADLERLRDGLARRGLELAQESGRWQLRRAGVPSAISPR
ncbi:MAG: DUF2066 domain-containing protein [Geminicoccaceae bacterium]|nr:DUF2066 domain-containing protein [Geminicoccaceae bacterium]